MPTNGGDDYVILNFRLIVPLPRVTLKFKQRKFRIGVIVHC